MALVDACGSCCLGYNNSLQSRTINYIDLK
jgi:hypothetical protein